MKQQRLDDIAQAIADDNVCPDLKLGATQLVFGDGSADADIVFIGEAPGKNEDLKGKPFVGAAGKFLDEMLTSIGYKRADVYITNIVKYRPPNNRDPLPEEKKAFLPYLQAQLEVIKPLVVATLGRHSMNCFLPDLQISQVHGEPKRIRVKSHELEANNKAAGRTGEDAMLGAAEQADKAGKIFGLAEKQDSLTIVILPLFHPAAALYNGSMRQTLIDDFARIPAILQKLQLTD